MAFGPHSILDAAMDNDLEKLKELSAEIEEDDFDYYVELVDSEEGWAAMHHATSNGNLEMIQFLVDKGKASVNCVTNEGDTPLHIAVELNNKDIVEALLNYGAVDTQNNKDHTALDIAKENDFFEIIALLEPVNLKPAF